METDLENNTNENKVKHYPTKIVFSYSLAGFGINVLYGMILTNTFYFYENFSGLSTGIVALAYVIFTIWDAINDPLLGILSDRPTKMSKKWGRRFPWMMISLLPLAVLAAFIYRPPIGVQWQTFMYMLGILIVYEVFFTLFSINNGALYPDKFRSSKNRSFYSIVSNILSLLGTGVGMILPPLLINYDDPSTYATGTFWVVLIALVPLVLSIPGCREDKDMLARNAAVELVKTEKGATWNNIKTIFKNRNFMSAFLVTFGVQILSACAYMSIPYFVTEVLELPDDNISLIFAGQIVGAAIGVLVWIPFIKKVDYVKTYKVGVFLMAGAMLPFMFLSNLIISVILAFIVGIAVSGVMITSTIMSADIIDESVLQTGERREGTYSGINVLANLISPAIATLIIAVTHLLTDYQGHDEDVSVIQTSLAKFGIRLHFSAIPVILCVIFGIIFLKTYKLTPAVAQENRAKLAELDF